MTEPTPAASVCLFCPETGEVLMGRRKTQPFLGYWALPGGRCEVGEEPMDTAIRELHEETGIELVASEPAWQLVVESAAQSETFRIHCFAFVVPTRLPAAPSSELEPEWVELARAQALSPMGPGASLPLAHLAEWVTQEST